MSVMQVLKFMAYKAVYLSQRYSHQAAVATILVINIYLSAAGVELGLTHGRSAEEIRSQIVTDRDATDPLSIWTPIIAELTHISRDDIESLYAQLIEHIDSKHFQGKLAAHRGLWLAKK